MSLNDRRPQIAEKTQRWHHLPHHTREQRLVDLSDVDFMSLLRRDVGFQQNSLDWYATIRMSLPISTFRIKSLQLPVLEVDYEELHENPKPVLAKVLAFFRIRTGTLSVSCRSSNVLCADFVEYTHSSLQKLSQHPGEKCVCLNGNRAEFVLCLRRLTQRSWNRICEQLKSEANGAFLQFLPKVLQCNLKSDFNSSVRCMQGIDTNCEIADMSDVRN